MRSLINYIRSCACKHDWELIFNIAVYGSDNAIPEYHSKIYRCKKCGMSKKYKSR